MYTHVHTYIDAYIHTYMHVCANVSLAGSASPKRGLTWPLAARRAARGLSLSEWFFLRKKKVPRLLTYGVVVDTFLFSWCVIVGTFVLL